MSGSDARAWGRVADSSGQPPSLWQACLPASIGCAEIAEHAAVATLAPDTLRGSAFCLLAAVQGAGNLFASTAAGLLYTVASPAAAFAAAASLMLIALPLLARSA